MGARQQPSVSTFLFADIAGYTALTEAHGDEDAAELARDFCRAVTELVSAEHGHVIKTIGDAVMVRHSEPAQAIGIGLRIAHDLMAGHGFPAVRVGMHHGPALEREGDWYGSTVNLAARVAGLAGGGEVLITNRVKEEAGDLNGISFEGRGRQRMRNVSTPIAVFAAIRSEANRDRRQLDPVCHMVVAEGRDAGRLRYQGMEYRFCSLECSRRFAGDPAAYVRAPAR